MIFKTFFVELGSFFGGVVFYFIVFTFTHMYVHSLGHTCHPHPHPTPILGFELRASRLLSRRSTTLANSASKYLVLERKMINSISTFAITLDFNFIL
jgi:hypothetical protein